MPGTTEPLVYQAVRAVGTLRPKIQPSSGRVFADHLDVRGTAFWLKDYKILITCSHVVQNLAVAPVEIAGLLVVGNRGNYQRAMVGLVDFDHDLAVLHLPPDTQQQVIDAEAATGLEITDSYPTVSTEVAYAGFPLGEQLLNSTQAPTYAEGVVGAQLRDHGRRRDIQIAGAVIGGFSGSPVVLKSSNKVVGVLSNSPSREAGTANIFMAVAWEHVKALAEMYKRNPLQL